MAAEKISRVKNLAFEEIFTIIVFICIIATCIWVAVARTTSHSRENKATENSVVLGIQQSDKLFVVISGDRSEKFAPMIREALRKAGLQIVSDKNNADVVVSGILQKHNNSLIFKAKFRRVGSNKYNVLYPSSVFPFPAVGIKDKEGWHFVAIIYRTSKVATR